jgi:hypothetical protein
MNKEMESAVKCFMGLPKTEPDDDGNKFYKVCIFGKEN